MIPRKTTASRKAAKFLTALLLSLSGFAAMTTPAQAAPFQPASTESQSQCGATVHLCLWSETGHLGVYGAYARNQSNLGLLNHHVGSMWNRTSHAVLFRYGRGAQPLNDCFRAGARIEDMFSTFDGYYIEGFFLLSLPTCEGT